MAEYRLLIKPSAAKEIDAIGTKRDRQRIVVRIQSLATDPRPHGCEKLAGPGALFRIRQGQYRVIYTERNIEEVLDSMEKMAKLQDADREGTKAAFVKLNEDGRIGLITSAVDLGQGISIETNADLAGDFHTYAADWQPGVVTWYFDGKQVYQLREHVPAQPMYIIANLAVGGNWPGHPAPDTAFPAYFEVDYIRVYQ